MSLRINNISKIFGTNRAVDNLSLEIPQGQIYGFLGANGAGKTTTFRMILGILAPTEGNATWDGGTINYSNSDEIGYLPEERGLYPKLKVKEQILYLGRLRGMEKDEIEKELNYWLERFNISEYLDKKLEELSKGNQQKIQFISAVINKPKLLLMDEPFSGLDPFNVEILKDAVISCAEQGTTIIFSSHRMDHVEELCENLCILNHGKTVLQGNLKEIKHSFGKKNILIETEVDIEYLNKYPEVTNIKKNANGYIVQITDDRITQTIITDIVSKGILTKFVLEEPSLNDIFIEKVGASFA